MSYLSILKTEITTDPLARGYSSMSHAEVAQDLNSIYRPRPFIFGYEILNETDSAEYLALTTTQQMRWERLATIPKINVSKGVGLGLLTELFGGIGSESNTFTNISQLQKQSRTEELELGTVNFKNIIFVRNQ